MDIKVNTSAFNKAKNDLKSHSRNINYVAKALLHNLRLAHEDFNDINYDRAENAIREVIDQINHFNRDIDFRKNFNYTILYKILFAISIVICMICDKKI